MYIWYRVPLWIWSVRWMGFPHVTYTALKANDWYVQKAKEAMEEGTLVYAGKYSAPDYEQLLQGGCTFAIENTMVTHNPEVKEKLEELGIRVMVERSSYEKSIRWDGWNGSNCLVFCLENNSRQMTILINR